MPNRPDVIDPTENVKALVEQNERFRREIREADQRLFRELRQADTRYQNSMREAETRRINDLYAQKTAADALQAELLRRQVVENAILLSAQMNKTADAQNERLSELERFRNMSAGAASGQSNVISYAFTGLTLLIALAALVLKH